MELEVLAKSFQYDFMNSESRYPAFISAVGTGKTYFMLLKIWSFCQKYPNSLALIVRKEYVDLKDSTMRDFEDYFDVKIGTDKNYNCTNGSCIMFRHGGEISHANRSKQPNILKNINLSIFGIEQGEEFETDEVFIFLRDRLRRKGSPIRQGIVIGNTNGHNWIWKLWKNNPGEEFDLYEANTFDNADNLPEDFIEDLKRMEKESPHHYNRFVMNSWEEMDDADILIPYYLIESSIGKRYFPEGAKILSCDVARYGDCKTVFNILQKANVGWKQVYLFAFQGQDTVKTFGHFMDLRKEYKTDFHVVDDVGLGGGVTDNLRAANIERLYPFTSNNKPQSEDFFDRRAECYWTLRDLFVRDQIQVIDHEEQSTELSSIKFRYMNGSKKRILSKEDMRKDGLKSPDFADALMMSMSVLPQAEAFEGGDFHAYAPYKPRYRPMSYGRSLAHRR